MTEESLCVIDLKIILNHDKTFTLISRVDGNDDEQMGKYSISSEEVKEDFEMFKTMIDVLKDNK